MTEMLQGINVYIIFLSLYVCMYIYIYMYTQIGITSIIHIIHRAMGLDGDASDARLGAIRVCMCIYIYIYVTL